MDLMNTIYEVMIASFDNEENLMEYAAIYGIQDSPLVRQRLFQLRNPQYGDEFVEQQLDSILQTLGTNTQYEEDLEMDVEYVRTQADIEELTRACIEDGEWDGLMNEEEMDQLAQTCIEDGDWQMGGGEEPQPGPSHEPEPQPGPSHEPDRLQYTIMKKSERTYAKNAATETVYKIKIHEDHQGLPLHNIHDGLHHMFEEVLNQARGAHNDYGRLVIHHDGLHDPIPVPIQRWDQLNADVVMNAIEKVLNSQQNLKVNKSFEVTVGSINMPKGGARRRITRIKGSNNSLDLKKSVVTIENEDQLCMARAIGVTWAKLKRCTPEEWKSIPRNGKSNLELILEHQKVPDSYYRDLTRKNLKQQGQLAQALCHMAGVPQDRPASINDIEAFENVLGVRVMVVSAILGNKFITSPSTDPRACIYIYHVDDNHFHAITSITGFFSSNHFCEKCLKHYDHREKHQCEEKCIVCKRDHCPTTVNTIKCQDCNMDCRSQDCFTEHQKVPVHKKGKHKGKPSGPSQCKKWWKCPTCFKVLNTEKRKKEEHQCGEYYCSSCKLFVLDDHKCYLRTKECKEDFIPKFIFFDFECSQDTIAECQDGYKPTTNCKDCQSQQVCISCSKCQNCRSSWCGNATHRPNFVVAHTVCPKCIDKELKPDSVCKGCGTRCEQCEDIDGENVDPCPGTCGFRETIFEGKDTTEKFGEWLFSDQHQYFKAVAHNMRGYDGYFLLEYLIDQSMRPDKIIYNGSKIMYMTVEKDLHIKVIDSLNFLPMKLSALPEAFGLKELKKGWFPHYFNTQEHQHYVGPYPEAKYYGHDFMSEKERGALLEWLGARTNEVFDFRQEMLEYCRSDVDILRQACMKFRELLMSATGEQMEVINDKGKKEKKWVGAVDPFDSVTIASVCMNVFRTKFLPEEWKVRVNNEKEWIPARKEDGILYVLQNNEWVRENTVNVTEKEFVRTHIAKIPPGGYSDQYSKASIQWLEWRARLDNVSIQHALKGGEKSIQGTRYKLDGYCAETNTAYEYNGCIYHGCPECFPDNRDETCHPLTNQSMNELYALTLKKKAHLKNIGMKYVSIWEHDFQKQTSQNVELKQFLDNLDLTDRLDPRDSFFGGRTNASQLYYQTKEGEQVRYVDFTSLYPWVNKYCQYPVGHPTIITQDFGGIEDYFGIAKVKIVPPRGLYHPVLPYRSNGKLKFPLCRTCADTENPTACSCSEENRALTGTWCTPEIQTAVRLGYQIKKIYEVYHWEETTQYDPQTQEGGLFAKYINTFLKFKQEASGPPDWIKTEKDAETYIQNYFQKEGVSLDREHIVKNPGLRALAKLCLNSFWGKFGQRLNMRQTEIFHESQANEFFQLFSDPMKQPVNFHILNNDMIQMEWVYKRDTQPEDNKTNIYLATFTTCWARLKLYSVLEPLNTRVLYYDTDSVIYVSRPGEYDPPLGDYLGDLTDELDGRHIVEFVSGGPKNYAYHLNRPDKKGKLCHCKVRGFTLNFTNSKLINFESVKSIVTDATSEKEITVTNPSKICRDKRKRKLYNREEKKTYQMVYTKRRRLDNFDTVPYGY